MNLHFCWCLIVIDLLCSVKTYLSRSYVLNPFVECLKSSELIQLIFFHRGLFGLEGVTFTQFEFRRLINSACYSQTLLIYKLELYERCLFIHCTGLMWRRLLFGGNNIKLDGVSLVLNKIQDNLTLTSNGVTILQLSGLINFNFFFQQCNYSILRLSSLNLTEKLIPSK